MRTPPAFNANFSFALYDNRAFGIISWLCSYMLHLTFVVVAKIIKPQTVTIGIDELACLRAKPMEDRVFPPPVGMVRLNIPR